MIKFKSIKQSLQFLRRLFYTLLYSFHLSTFSCQSQWEFLIHVLTDRLDLRFDVGTFLTDSFKHKETFEKQFKVGWLLQRILSKLVQEVYLLLLVCNIIHSCQLGFQLFQLIIELLSTFTHSVSSTSTSYSWCLQCNKPCTCVLGSRCPNLSLFLPHVELLYLVWQVVDHSEDAVKLI